MRSKVLYFNQFKNNIINKSIVIRKHKPNFKIGDNNRIQV